MDFHDLIFVFLTFLEQKSWECLLLLKIIEEDATYTKWTVGSYKETKSGKVRCIDRYGKIIEAERENSVINVKPRKESILKGKKVLAPVTRDKYNREVYTVVEIDTVMGDTVTTTPPGTIS